MAAEAIPFPFLDPDDVRVTHIADATGVRTLLASGTDYTIAGDGPTKTGTITAVASWPALDDFELLRITPELQPVHVEAGQPLPSKAVERALDRLAMGQLEASEQLGRSLQVPPGESTIYLPAAADRAGKLAKWGDLPDAPLDYLDIDVVALADQVATDAAQVTIDANQVAIDRAIVEANTAAYGSNVRVFATYAAALAAIGTTLSNGMYAEIMSDELDLFERTRRPVSGGVLGAVSAELPKLVQGSDPYFMATTHTRFVTLLDNADGVLKPYIYPHVYIDEVNGSDANDGSAGVDRGGGKGPIKTVAKFLTLPACQDGVTVALKDNGIWSSLELDFAEPTLAINGNKTLSRFSLVPYGNGSKLMKMKGTDPVPAASWSASVSNPGAYEITWSHGFLSVGTPRALMCTQKQVSTVVPWEPLVRKQNKNQVTAQGMYWYDSNLAVGVAEAMCVWPWDNINLTTAPDGTIELGKRSYAITGRDNCYFSGFYTFGYGCNNGGIFTYAGPVAERCLYVLGGKHNAVLGGGFGTDLGVFNCQPSTSYWPETGGIPALIACFEGDMHLRSPVFKRCSFFCDDTVNTHAESGRALSQSFLAHAVTGGLAPLLTFIDCADGNVGFGPAHSIFASWSITGHYSTGYNGNNAGFTLNTGLSLTVRDSLFVTNGTGAGDRTFTVPVGCAVDVQGSIFIGGPSNGFLSLAGGAAVTVKNNVFINEGGAGQYFISANANIATSMFDIQHNIFSFGGGILDFGTDPAASPLSVTIDYNYYDMYPYFGGSTDAQARWKNHLYRTPGNPGVLDKDFTADWQGVLGFDTHGAAAYYTTTGANSDTVGWAGNSPTSVNPELAVLSGGSPMAGKISILPAATITTMKARPQTISAFLAYAESAACPTYHPVYEG
jgi:hypothetical protein